MQLAHPKDLVICVAGEASVLMNMQEMSTAAQYRLPIKIFILNNEYMGMVRQWQELLHGGRYSESYSAALPDFVKLAEAYHAKGIRCDDPAKLDAAIMEMLDYPGPVIFDCLVAKEENCFPMIPSGKAHNEMILRISRATPATSSTPRASSWCEAWRGRRRDAILPPSYHASGGSHGHDRFHQGTVIIPKSIRDELGIEAGAKLKVTMEGRSIVMEASRPFPRRRWTRSPAWAAAGTPAPLSRRANGSRRSTPRCIAAGVANMTRAAPDDGRDRHQHPRPHHHPRRRGDVPARTGLVEGPILVPTTVLLEAEWVLRDRYGLDRGRSPTASRPSLAFQRWTCDARAIHAALNLLRAGIDFADALHLSTAAPARRFVTLDTRSRAARALATPTPVVLA